RVSDVSAQGRRLIGVYVQINGEASTRNLCAKQDSARRFNPRVKRAVSHHITRYVLETEKVIRRYERHNKNLRRWKRVDQTLLCCAIVGIAGEDDGCPNL